ncbi:helix-turn-helix domain-containing protein [Klebsiella quasipneumoniae subsp. quasipneumoniae]|uniref:DNA N-6-adenine-methyltransferase n=2 Tax=Klebsiella pneumoniae complex TaxID=3390273 RepID=UPI00217E8C44|nr:DNA N-6-adenine-methyltransferase [Klebsiella quasipneumoniae]MCS5752137.1 helix-turn-helix domain-containing protein [Klebsiella quasipneumoniae subsp. quasipneumoniae]
MKKDSFRFYGLNGVFNGGSDSWGTPIELFDSLNAEFNFTIDAAANKFNALCDRYWTEDDDALKQDWNGEVIFCNPPYSRTGEFLAKGKEAKLSVFVVGVRTQATYFLHQVFANPYCHEIRFLHRGVAFIPPDGGREKSVRSALPICVIVYRNTPRTGDIKISVACADTGTHLLDVTGRSPGQPSKHDYKIRDAVIQAHRKGAKVADLVERFGVSRATIYRWVKG